MTEYTFPSPLNKGSVRLGLVIAVVMLVAVAVIAKQKGYFPGSRSIQPTSEQGTQQDLASVLGTETASQDFSFNVNVPSFFSENTVFAKDLEVQGKIINSLLFQGVKAGTGITVSTGTTPTIANSGVLSLGGEKGELSLAAGSGISVDGLTIKNTDAGSAQSIFKTISVTGGSSFSAGSNSDTLTFIAGTGIGVSADAQNKTITFTGTADPGFTDDGTIVRLSTITDQLGIGTRTPTGKVNIVDTSEQLRLGYDGSTFTAFTVSSGGNLSIAPSGGTTNVLGAQTVSGAFSANGAINLGDASTDDVAFNGKLTTSIIPKININVDLGSEALRFNNLYVQNINSNQGISTLGQAHFTYSPADVSYTEASVKINPTTAGANTKLLGLGIAGFERAGVDAEGDLVLGYNNLVTAPSTDDPLTVYGHNNTRVMYVNTSGDLTIAGNLLTTGGSTFSSNITMADDTWIGLAANKGRIEFDDQATSEINFLDTNIGIGTSTPNNKLDILSTTSPQLRVGYDTSNYTTMGVSATGATTFTTNGTAPSLTLATGANNGNILLSPNGTGSVQLTSGVTTGTGTSSGLSLVANSLSAGTGLNLSSTSTGLTTGGLMALDWSPGSATTATGDLLSLNIGANGLIGNFFNIKDNGSSVFSVSQSQITSALPHQFTAPGDVAIAYDLNFTNQTIGNITSYGPLNITAGEPQESNNLQLSTYNSGRLVFDSPGGVVVNQAQAWDLANSSVTSLNIESGLMDFDTTNSRIGIGTAAPASQLDMSSTAPTFRMSDTTASAKSLLLTTDANASIFSETGGAAPNLLALDLANARIGVGTAAPASQFDVSSTAPTFRMTDTTASAKSLLVTTDANASVFSEAGGAAPNLLALDLANARVGLGTAAPNNKLEVLSTTSPQFRAAYDTSNYATLGVSVTGATTLTTAGSAPSLTLSTGAANGNIALSPNGTGSVQITSGVTTGTTTSSALSLAAASLTQGTGLDIAVNALTTGKALNISSTSTVLSTGSLGVLDWSPGSATTATGDLLSLNIGANGVIGNIFNVKDNGSSVFSVSQSQITSALPHQFTAAGDVSMSYDLNMTNGTASYINYTDGPGYIRTVNASGNNDLTLSAANSGAVIIDDNAYVQNNFVVGGSTSSTETITNAGFTMDTDDLFVAGMAGFEGNVYTDGAFVAGSGTTYGDGVVTLGAGTNLNFDSNTLVVDNANNRVGVGTATPGARLDVVGGQTQIEISTQYGERLCHGGSDGAATQSVLLGDCLTGGNDVAEFYRTSGTVEPGDAIIAAEGDYTVARTDSSYQSSVLGIVSTNPSSDVILGTKVVDSNRQPVALVGRIPVKVSLENGAIRRGDALTSSSTPGVVMKATHAGVVVGRALEDYNGMNRVSQLVQAEEGERNILHVKGLPTYTSDSSQWPATVGKIMVFVGVSWFDPGITLAANGELASIPSPRPAVLGASDQANTSTDPQITESLQSLKNSVSSLSFITSAQDVRLASVEAQLATLQNSSHIVSEPDVTIASAEGTLAKAIDLLDGKTATLSALMVTGSTNLYDLSVTGTFSSGLLSIAGLQGEGDALGAAVNSTGVLYLQKEPGLSGVDIFSGKIVMSRDGNIQTTGEITASKLNIKPESDESASIGTGMMKSGKTKAVIATTAVTKNSRIFVTASDTLNYPLAVTATKAGESFTVEMKKPEEKDVEFSWLIIN